MYTVVAKTVGLSVEQVEFALAGDTLLREMAESGGMSMEEITALADGAYRDLVLRALACGLLKWEEVDHLLTCRSGRADVLFECLRPAGGYRQMLHGAAASVLGMRLEDLETAFHNGQTLRQVAESRGIDIAEVRAALKQVHRDQIRQAVNDGELSSAQARHLQEQIAPVS